MLAVTFSGSASASCSANCLANALVCLDDAGSIGTYRCMPLFPDVFGQPSMP